MRSAVGNIMAIMAMIGAVSGAPIAAGGSDPVGDQEAAMAANDQSTSAKSGKQSSASASASASASSSSSANGDDSERCTATGTASAQARAGDRHESDHAHKSITREDGACSVSSEAEAKAATGESDNTND